MKNRPATDCHIVIETKLSVRASEREKVSIKGLYFSLLKLLCKLLSKVQTSKWVSSQFKT